MKLRVIPGYGWGWFRDNGSPFDVPSAFDLDAEAISPGNPFKIAQGFVDGDHPLSGMWVVLIQRHDPTDGECSLYAVTQKLVIPETPQPFPAERKITGYAKVENSN